MSIRVQFPKEKDVTDVLWPTNSNVSTSAGAEKPLVVILLGWAGCSYKHLSKYSDEYLKRGCVVVQYICPAEYTSFQTGRLPQAAHAILQKLKEEKIVGNPTFVHAFSNNGTVMYSHLLREFARCQDDIPVDLRGTIIDSAPVRRLFGPFMRMLPTLMPSQLGLLRYPAAGLATFVLALWTTIWYIRYAASMVLVGERIPQPLSKNSTLKEAVPLHNWLTRMVGIKNHPFLFLYSSADHLLNTAEIVKIADAVKSRGNPVKLVDFEDSQHCQHLRQHQKKYLGHIQNFIKTTMENNHGQPKYWDELD